MQLWQVFFKNIFKNIKKTNKLLNGLTMTETFASTHKHFSFKRNVSISIQKK